MDFSSGREDLTPVGQRNDRLISKIELVIVSATTLVTFIVFCLYAGGSIAWDELLYMHYSHWPEPEPKILNRFAHIYFQRFFFLICDDPFLGARFFSAFVHASCVYLTYWLGRLLMKDSHWWNGLLAVAFYFGSQKLLPYLGVTFADYTVMFWLSAGALGVLVADRAGRLRTPYAAYSLAIIFLIALRSKETGIVCGLPILAVFSFPIFSRQNVRLLCASVAGVLSGLAILAAFDFIVLGDLFYFFRPENWQRLFSFNI